MIEIKMPEAGFSITEGKVIEWYKGMGDRVEEGENVVSVETDKITVEIPAERGGVLQEVRYTEGEIAPVGGVMGIILEDGEEPVKVIKEASQEVEKEIELQVENRRKTGAAEERKISPAAKAVARVKGVDLSLIREGSGPHGRIVKKDVLEFVAKSDASRAGVEEMAAVAGTVGRIKEEVTVGPVGKSGIKEAVTVGAGTESGIKVEGGGSRIEFTGWRKVVADRMVSSFREIPHYTMSIEADVTELANRIKVLRGKEDGLHITYMPFMMKAIVVGLEEVPYINALCDGKGFTMRPDINIGVAVDIGEKLLVPVVKDVKRKSILELVYEVDDLAKKAREDRLETKDVQDGTITLTNVGMFQTHSATSIILQPQVAIIYMGAARDVPAVWDGKIEVRKKMIFGATYDHRVVNGAAGGRFLKKVKECLEDIGVLMIRIR
jgi:pyruvate/2-oxoglutarate dehydrogenase complex dihydrolipoamide acyltransferase (E2) component